MSELTPNNYLHIVASLKEKIRQAKTKASLAVNKELLNVYWEIGNTILEQQKTEGWGSKVIDRLSQDLKHEFPDMQGLSIRNIKYMRAFAEAYPEFVIVQPTLAQIQNTDNQLITIVQHAVAQLPWSHNIVLLDKVKNLEERVFYAQKTIENNWSKNVLILQIDNKLIERQGKAITNFPQTLPLPQADLAKEMLKNPYVLDFFGVTEEMKERDIENALIVHLKKFILELGRGFAYVGNQFNLNVAGDDFYLDLLFYNTRLHCYVVFELKVGEFKPEFAGKLNFYLNAIDEQIKTELDKPTIGVLLCKTPNETVIEYALRGIDKPMGVADYELRNVLPENLKSDLPSIEELEHELEKETENIETPLKEGIDKIKSLIANLKKDKVEKRLDPQVTLQLFNDVLVPLYHKLKNQLKDEIEPLFESVEILISGGISAHEIEKVHENLSEIGGQIQDLKLVVRLRGFKAAGENAFDVNNQIIIDLEPYKYICRFSSENKTQYVKLYHQLFNHEELNTIVITFCKTLMNEIIRKLENIK